MILLVAHSAQLQQLQQLQNTQTVHNNISSTGKRLSIMLADKNDYFIMD